MKQTAKFDFAAVIPEANMSQQGAKFLTTSKFRAPTPFIPELTT